MISTDLEMEATLDRPLRCLSRMRRNLRVRFLEGLGPKGPPACSAT
jgi:hypothetical protein